MRRNSDEDLRDLERRIASGDVGALAAYDRAFTRAFGLQALARRYAQLLLIEYRKTPDGQEAKILVPDGVSDRPDGIAFTARHDVGRHSRVQVVEGQRSFVEEDRRFLSLKAVLLPGLPEEFYCPKVPEYADTLQDAPPGVLVQRLELTADDEESRRRFGAAIDVRNLIRDESDQLEWMIGWGDREFLLQAERAFLVVRENVAKVFDRRVERHNKGLDVWANVQRRLRSLAARVATGEKQGRNMSHLWGEAVNLLRGVQPPMRGVAVRPINAAGEGWSRWATERLAELLEATPFNDAGRPRRLTVTANRCSLWSTEGSNLGMSSLEVLPVGVSRSWQGANRETVRVGIVYPGSMDFSRLVAKAKSEPLSAWELLHPTTGKFELTLNWGATHRTQSLAKMIESVILENFPGARVEIQTRRP